MDLHLTDRVALVTGASKGIGLAVARTLAAEGARVVAVSRTATPELAETGALHVAADLTEPDAPAAVVARAVERDGRIDVVVNNAGRRRRREPAPRTPASSRAATRTGRASSSSTSTPSCGCAAPRCR